MVERVSALRLALEQCVRMDMDDVESIEREAISLLRQRKNDEAITLLGRAAHERQKSRAFPDEALLIEFLRRR